MIVDTNIIVRALMDNTAQGELAREIIRNTSHLYVDDMVLFESVYVLESVYDRSRDQIAEGLKLFVEGENIVYETGLADVYLDLYKQTGLDLADCYLLALALQRGESLMSFDKKLMNTYKKIVA